MEDLLFLYLIFEIGIFVMPIIIIVMWLRIRHWKHIYFDFWMDHGFRVNGLHKKKGMPHPCDNRKKAQAVRVHKLWEEQ